MDNLKYYNDSLAYDFSMFMPREKRQDNIVKLPKLKTKTKARAATKKVSVTFSAILISTFILAVLCGNIFLRLKINEINTKINATKAEIEELKSEKTEIEVELERKLSFSNVEVEATEMGMRKKDKSQVKYIKVNKNNTAVKEDGNVVISND